MILIKKLNKIILKHFPEADSDSNKWQEVLKEPNRDPSIPHLFNSVKYFVAYFSNNDSLNLSFVLNEKKRSCRYYASYGT